MRMSRVRTAALMGMTIAGLAISAMVSVALGQERFPTPEAAVQSLMDAAKAREPGSLDRLFGEGAKELIRSGDDEVDRQRLADFLAAAAKGTKIEEDGPDKRVLVLGDDWTFPIPIVHKEDTWIFDLEAGRQEIQDRAIGRNELAAISACKTFVDAQFDYAKADRDNDFVLEYAQLGVSNEGQQDGLYWPSDNALDLSPLDEKLGDATIDPGMSPGEATPWNGYVFRILTGQGPDAPGGKHGYVINGNMIAGFAIAAFPAEWDKTGIMTFICGQQGIVYQKDLGPETAKAAATMTTYNPGSDWAEAEPQEESAGAP